MELRWNDGPGPGRTVGAGRFRWDGQSSCGFDECVRVCVRVHEHTCVSVCALALVR